MPLGHFASRHFAAQHFAALHLRGTAADAPPAVTTPVGGGRWRRVDRQRPAAIVYRPLALQARGATLARVAVAAEALLQLAAAGRSAAALAIAAEAPIRGAARGASHPRVTLRTEIDPAITAAEVAMVMAWMRAH